MILLYQITHSNTDDSLLHLFMTASVATTRGHNFKFFKPRCNSRCRFNSFSCRTIDNWNNLPTYIVNANSVNSFKNLLDNFWTKYIYCTIDSYYNHFDVDQVFTAFYPVFN